MSSRAKLSLGLPLVDQRCSAAVRMDQEEADAGPPVLSPRSKKRKAVKESKAEARSRDPVAYKALRAEQERNRVRNNKDKVAAKAAFAAEANVVPMPMPPPHAAATANAPLSTIEWSDTAMCEPIHLVPPPSGDATIHLALPYGLTPLPPSPIPPPILPPFTPPFTPFAPLALAPRAPPPAPPKKDGRTFEQKKIKELEGKVKDLEAAVRTRDHELDGFADSLYAAVKAATEVRDAPPPTDLATMLSIPLCVRTSLHKPEDINCQCACCFHLSFFARPLAQRAAYLERKRAEDV
jgi:hypothetical protein